MRTTISVRLPEEIAARLHEVATATERSKTFHVEKALETYLEEQADLQIALDRLRDTADETISMDALRRELEL